MEMQSPSDGGQTRWDKQSWGKATPEGPRHDDVIKWKHFPRYWPFVRGIHRSPVNSPHNGQQRGVFGVFFKLRLNQLFSKQWRRRWFETPSRSLRRHCNGSHHPLQLALTASGARHFEHMMTSLHQQYCLYYGLNVGLVPSLYLNQCWLIVNSTLRNKLQRNFNRNPNIFIQEYV